MSSCELSVRFNDGRREYQPGDVVEGEVVADVDKPCRCDGLKLDLFFRTHGRGNVREGERTGLELFRGDWEPGTHACRFKVRVPAGPLTYHGELLNVDWYLEARADIPWALDPHALADFVVRRGSYRGAVAQDFVNVPDDDARMEILGSRYPLPWVSTGRDSRTRDFRSKVFASGCLLLFLSPFLVIGGSAFVSLIRWLLGAAEGEGPAFAFVLTSVFFLGLPGGAAAYVLFRIWRSSIAERKLGPVELELTPRDLRPGGSARLSLHFVPRARAELNEVTATLRGREIVTSGSGTSRHTYRHTLCEEGWVLERGGSLLEGDSFEKKLEVTVPESAAPSFRVEDNRILWELEVRVDVAGWPDWLETREITIQA